MPVVPIAAGIAAAATVVGTVATIGAQNKANNLAKQQFTYEKQLNQNNATRQRRDAIRAARMTQGSIVQTGNNQGAADTSSALGGLGSIQSQLDDNLSFMDTNTTLANKATDLGEERQSAMANAGNWAAISSLGMQVFSLTSGGKGKKVR
jgi:hypothetical protein